MNILQQNLLHARAAGRRALSRLGLTDPAWVRPARLVLRLDTPAGVAPLSLARWQARLVDAVGWLGPLPVSVLAGTQAASPLTLELVRFAHRLDCPTLLVCDGTGIGADVALALVDSGLGAVRVEIGGVSEGVQASVMGAGAASAQAAADAVRALLAARQERRAHLDVEVVLPWQGRAQEEARALLGWARQVGCDGFRITPPWRAVDLPADPELLDRLVEAGPPFVRTPRAAALELHAMVASPDGEPGMSRRRRGRRCPVGGQRLEIDAAGELRCCPFKAPIPPAESLAAAWQGAGAHLAEVRACGRACAHVELAPMPVLG